MRRGDTFDYIRAAAFIQPKRKIHTAEGPVLKLHIVRQHESFALHVDSERPQHLREGAAHLLYAEDAPRNLFRDSRKPSPIRMHQRAARVKNTSANAVQCRMKRGRQSRI
jgi:hypothetical protein